MLREFLKTLIEIRRIDLHMLNASHRVDGQNFSAFHSHNLFHHLRAVFSATPFFKTKGTFWLCASSTLRKCKTLAPQKHISDNDAKSSWRKGFEFATMRGSAEQTPSPSLIISTQQAFSTAAMATAVVSLPPRPSVVISLVTGFTP